MHFYPAFKPNLNSESEIRIINCLKENSISGNFGSEIAKLETSYSLLHNNAFSVSCSSGTSALHLACLGLGMQNYHNVVVPSITNMASFFAPIYCDILSS